MQALCPPACSVDQKPEQPPRRSPAVGYLHQDHVTRMTFDQGRDVAVL